jgi:hypothetical protein
MVNLFWLSLALATQENLSLPIFPPPRQVEVLGSSWQLQLPIRVEAPETLQRPAELLRKELRSLFGENAVSEKGKTVVTIRHSPSITRREEEYAIDATSHHIIIHAHDLQGAFWAVHSLVQVLSSDIIAPTSTGWRLPRFRVRDFPESNFRAFMLQGAWDQDLEGLKIALELLARFKVRYVAVEFGPQIVLDFDPSIARGARFSKQQAKGLMDYARSLGLEPIGYLNLLGHLDRAYQKSPYTDHGGIMVQNEEVYEKFVFPILSEMLEVYGPIKWFHCGMDEAFELFEWLSSQGYDSASLLARHIAKINEFLKQKGVRMVIWHDMLFSPDLQTEIGAPIGPANGGPPRNTAKAIELIPKDVVVNYWFYEPLDAYPALDWLKAKGFEVWASPWQTPFSLVRYAQKRNIPTLGTIWAGSPHLDTFGSFAPVMALYAWASWNPQSAPEGTIPEKEISPKALQATLKELWGRKRMGLTSKRALLIRPADGKVLQLNLPQQIAKAPEQHYGIPFDFSEPFTIPPLKGKTAANLEKAAFVLLPDGTRLKLDGVNKARGEDELILYTSPLKSTGTNIWGVEVAVSAFGEVIGISGYGSGNMPIPTSGFVLSAHFGPKSEKANALQRLLKHADRVVVLDAEGNILCGLSPFKVKLPDGTEFSVDGVNKERGEDELVLYLPNYGGGWTRTNQYGVEVIVVEGKVVEVRDWVGNASIPQNGYVLSAHYGRSSEKAKALAKLKPGDEVKVLISADSEVPLDEAIKRNEWHVQVEEKCQTLFFAVTTFYSSVPSSTIGEFIVNFADGTKAVIPIRYGLEALPLKSGHLPTPERGRAWLAFRETEPQRLLVTEWTNPKPDTIIDGIRFIPSPFGLVSGVQILGITAEVR